MATKDAVSFLEGSSIEVLGIFSSYDKALECIKTKPYFKECEKLDAHTFKYIFDGELNIYYEITEIELDKEIL
jgi:hypothetical protein